jgi:hypothetical protein
MVCVSTYLGRLVVVTELDSSALSSRLISSAAKASSPSDWDGTSVEDSIGFEVTEDSVDLTIPSLAGTSCAC